MRVANSSRSQTGESPLWSASENALYWVDIWAKRVRRLDWATREEREYPLPEMAGAVIPSHRGGLVVCMETGLFHLDPASGAVSESARPSSLPATHRLNDATTDPCGRLIVGSMRKSDLGQEPSGVLYAYDGRAWRTLLDGFWTVNGLAFSPDGRTLYVSDSHPRVRCIWVCDYDTTLGAIGSRRVFVDMTSGFEGRPDGGAVDCDGYYWSAGVGGGVLYRFAPDGALDAIVPTPTENPTKLAFAGPDLSVACFTSLAINLKRPDPLGLAGVVFAFEPCRPGYVLPSLCF